MLLTLIHFLQDVFLKLTKTGIPYSVPVFFNKNEIDDHSYSESDTEETIVVVWAKNEQLAQKKAIEKVANNIRMGKFKFDSMGLIQGKDFYKPRSFRQAVSSPIAVWRDPVYKRALYNMTNGSGQPTGTMLKGAWDELTEVTVKRHEKDGELSIVEINRFQKNNIISLFIWLSFMPVSFLFFYSAITMPEIKLMGLLLSPQFISAVVTFIIGFGGILSGILDYKKIKELKQGFEG